ncbi:MAG TPA: hypothetical protein PLS94_13590 [Prolixibacteraceae bacterium]|nr:hypothetical protein [Prolixibacteraceae bacterium]
MIERTCHIFFLFFVLTSIVSEAQKPITAQSMLQAKPVLSENAYSDMGPFLVEGILYFASQKQIDKKTVLPFFDIYSTPMHNSDLNITTANKSLQLSTPLHDGQASYCEKTKELFITTSDKSNAFKKRKLSGSTHIPLKIVIYRFNNNNWEYFMDFPYNVKHSTVAHPAINSSGDTLVFASNQPGGYGLSDLYMSVRQNGEWQKPVNLGPKINNKKRQITPFIDAGKLYYSTDDYQKKGKLNIYVSNLSQHANQTPQRLPHPFNTKRDDFGLCLHPNQKVAYLVSNRGKKNKHKPQIFQLKTSNFEFKHTPTDSAQMWIDNQMQQMALYIDSTLKQMNQNDLLPKNVALSTRCQLTDTTNIPDLKVSIAYKLLNDSVFMGKNSYSLSKYLIEESNIALALAGTLEECFNRVVEKVEPGDKKISFDIYNSSDFFNIVDSTFYKGEFGDTIVPLNVVDHYFDEPIIANETIIDSEQLVFLRAYAFKHFLGQKMPFLENSESYYTYHLINAEEMKQAKEWIKVEFSIENAFANY